MFHRTFSVLLLGCVLALGGCVTHVHHGDAGKSDDVLETEHKQKSIVIIHKRPKKNRHGWKHRHHWHCHK